jgi:cysteinyl-tRNA synthetase
MDDDFNTAAVLGLLFELVRQINQAREDGATDEQLRDAQATLRELSEVLGVRLIRLEKEVDPAVFYQILKDLNAKLASEKISDFQLAIEDGNEKRTTPQLIDALVQARDALRARKLWTLSDQIRKQLADHGVLVEDSAGGSSWRWE